MDRGPDDVDPLLTRVAADLLDAHRPDPAEQTRCAHARCRQPYPCRMARLATEALDQAAAHPVGTGSDLVDTTSVDRTPEPVRSSTS